MINIILGLIKVVLGMKFGWLIAIVAGIVIGGSIIRNILTGSFSVVKLASGFNPFTGAVQGKLIYYGLILVICFGVYHQLTRATYDTDYTNTYKNNVHNNENVVIDQKQIIESQEDLILVGVKIFGLKIGITCKATPKPREIIDNSKIKQPKVEVPIIVEKKLNPLTAPFRWIGKLFKKGK